ncbi:hypothetical protein [Rivihabitans pingtungensis]|jgi:hypothetical protein|uniref:Uncharacterized protein n=1 Tax=Rivihabitans pingtungensis TaxID=1054498 RepID=A0A318KGR7_9NEIS|nr:hypothetical protein [Rivihabitans pingtungensis]PXX77011.1 hypothetical protein DFR34_11912 [Rivihabitans pingtungensis]
MRINPAYKKIIEETMERYGIQDHRLEMGGKHAHLLFSHDGRSHKVTIPGSPSDSQRGLKNFACDLRRRIVGMNVNAASDMPAEEILPDADLLEKIQLRLAENPPQHATERDFQALKLLDGRMRSAVAIGQDAHADNPAAWGVERLERLVWLGLAEGDGQGRYRKMGGTRQ